MRPRARGVLTSRYGCLSASSTSIRRFGLNVRHFSIRSIACPPPSARAAPCRRAVVLTRGFAVGKSVLNGFFFRNGSARMYSRDRCEVIA